MNKKSIFSALVVAGSFAISSMVQSPLTAQQAAVELDVYKEPTCGCCVNWIEHMQLNDFVSTVHHPSNLNGLKLEHGIRPELQSCHTAITKDGYVFEGHVPAKFIQQFLAAPPANAKGLAVPGMPLESPGMEVGARFTPYDVILLNKDGSVSVYASIESVEDQF